MATMTNIPVVDMRPYRIDMEDKVDTESLQIVGNSICGAFRDIGFCYIKNHGIQQALIDKMLSVSKTFFEMPPDLNPKRPSDYKESYKYTPQTGEEVLPDSEGFEETIKNFRASCETLALRILDLLSIGLGLEDKHFLRKCHARFGQSGNSSLLKTMLYPALPENAVLEPNQLWCGEHTDFGSLSMLFQDDTGGLEVKNLDGKYIPATPMPGTIVINIGDMMQRWTSDQLIATEHRVVISEKESKRKMSRQSLAFFIQPDDDVVIQSLTNNDKYKPITSVQYLRGRHGRVY
ncbi:uncharacterized protein [Argopecten irradians]|uniref:uncharacterized protein n=1 Tax=Argopecten irradians TaxID=31199 RepID=UPI00371434A2